MTHDPMSPVQGDHAATSLRWLAFALLVMPFWQLAGSDYDRSGALVLLGPVLWSGRQELLAGFAEWWRTRRVACWLGLWLLFAGSLSTALSTHSAASVVMIARWIILGAAAVLTGRLARALPAGAASLLPASLALGTALGVITVWVWWFAGTHSRFPLYFHFRHLGYHTLMGAVAVTWLIGQAGRVRKEAAGWMVVGIVIWSGLFWSGSRGPMIALAGALGLVLWHLPWKNARSLLAVVAVQTVAGLAISQWLATPEPYLGWLHAAERTTTATTIYEVTSVRSSFWLSAWQHFVSGPLIGLGPDAYQFLVPKLDGQQPHNFVLQFLLDAGLVGVIPALGLLGLGLYRAWKQLASLKTAPTSAWVWPALLAGGTALGCVDGTFYHLIALLPVTVAWGACLSLGKVGGEKREVPALPGAGGMPAIFPARLGAALTMGAALILVFHGWLFYQVASAPPPFGPSAFVARMWRHFPSPTLGLTRWFSTWADNDPAAALEWTLWTVPRTPNATLFRVQAARLLLEQNRRAEAEQQLRLALAEAHSTRAPYVQSLLDQFFPMLPR